MRIAHFLSSTGHGGDALATLALARGQVRLGHHVHVAIGSSDHSAAFVERAKQEGIDAAEWTDLPLAGSLPAPRRAWTFMRGMQSLAPDVVHVHTGGLAVRAADVLGSRGVRARARVATVHWPFPWAPGSEGTRQRWSLLSRLFDHVLCPSSVSRNQQILAGLSPSKVTALPNAVDVERFRRADRHVVRAEFGFADSDPLVLFLARVEKQKRPLDALAAFRELSSRHPRARMLVAGTGDLEESCKQFVNSNHLETRVSFLGYRTDVPNLMRAADIDLLPTESESFGITFAEAMAAETPIVTSNIAPLVGEVIPEGCALFVDVGDVNGLTEAMSKILESRALSVSMTEKAKAIVAERYGLEAVAKRHVDLYERVSNR